MNRSSYVDLSDVFFLANINFSESSVCSVAKFLKLKILSILLSCQKNYLDRQDHNN